MIGIRWNFVLSSLNIHRTHDLITEFLVSAAVIEVQSTIASAGEKLKAIKDILSRWHQETLTSSSIHIALTHSTLFLLEISRNKQLKLLTRFVYTFMLLPSLALSPFRSQFNVKWSAEKQWREQKQFHASLCALLLLFACLHFWGIARATATRRWQNNINSNWFIS